MGKISITPQMLRTAVKELQMHQLFVKLKNLRDHIRRHYPVERDFKAFERELRKKLEYAVCAGLLIKHKNDQYCIPNLRQDSNNIKTAMSTFWELYEKDRYNTRKRKINVGQFISHKKRKHMNHIKNNKSDHSDDFDLYSSSIT